MKKSRAFRPVLNETLEDRSVPSGFGFNLFGIHIGFGGFGGFGDSDGGGSRSIQNQDANQVSQAFRTFQRTYDQAVRSLEGPGGSLSTFNSQVSTGLTTLNQSVGKAIANLPTSSNPTLATTISGDLLGAAGSNSLQGVLANLTPPTGAPGSRAVAQFIEHANRTINQSRGTVVGLVRSAAPPVGIVTPQTLETAQTNANTAFENFRQSYNTALQTYQSALSSSTGASGAAAQFSASLKTNLATLNSSVTGALTGLPSALTSTLSTTLSNDVLTNGSTAGTSLQDHLNALTLPTGAGNFAFEGFRFQANQDISLAQNKVASDIQNAVQQYNNSL